MIPRGLFITGTDTGVGKTRITAAIVRSLCLAGQRVGALKPVSTSGIETPEGLVSPDALELCSALGGDIPPRRVAPLTYRGDVAPSLAMRLEGRAIGRAEVMIEALDAARSRIRYHS